MNQQCSMCPFYTKSRRELMYHLLHRHRNAANFIIHCSAGGCGSSFRKLETFRRHCERKHGDLETEIDTLSDQDDNNEIYEAQADREMYDYDMIHSEFDNRVQDAQYLLRLKAGHNLSQAAVSEIMASTSVLISYHMEASKKKIREALPPEVIDNIDLEGVFLHSPFSGLETEYRHEKFLEDHMGYIKPCAVKLGEINKVSKVQGDKRFVPREVKGYTVPFFPQLTKLLSMPEVHECLSSNRDDIFEFSDFSDGTYMQRDFFTKHPKALLFGLYFDDFEIANPIGSHKKKHKLSVFYWSLLNILPSFRYKLQSTQLLAVANTRDIKKFGFQAILREFVDAMKALHNGCELSINGTEKTYHGTLLCAIGDTPAAQLLGGFKEGVGFAEKPCRTCEVSHNELDQSMSANLFPLRDELEHRDRCDSLLATLTKGTRKYWSKKYGIVSASVLLDIPEFSVTKCILHDPMHVLLEGIVKTELQLLLEHLIERKKYFTLQQLNKIIRNFDYGIAENDKPQPLDSKSLHRKSTFPMTAVEAMHFMTMLPFMIGDKIEEDDINWSTFLILMQITHLVISPVASSVTVDSLVQLIFQHNSSFKKIYPNVNFTPKLHYLTHFPDQIKQFGPGRNHWCMRFEAKHGLFKNKKWRNFKNISQSLALYHQRWMCLQQAGNGQESSEVYLYRGDTVKEGIPISQNNISDEMRSIMQEYEGDLPENILQTSSVAIRDISYHCESVLLLDYSGEADEPHFVIIDNIYVVNDTKFIEGTDLIIEYFNTHLNAFECMKSTNKSCLRLLDLKYKWPQTVHNKGKKFLVMLRHVDFAWCL